jgi:hypothetical protein
MNAIQEDWKDKYQVLIRPTPNPFASMRPEISVDCVHDPEQYTYCNWGMFAIQGIGTEVHERRDDFDVEDSSKKKSFWPFTD